MSEVRAAESNGTCSSCQRRMDEAATDECQDRAHRATDETLGLRGGSCGCCVIVDATALGLLRQAIIQPDRETRDVQPH